MQSKTLTENSHEPVSRSVKLVAVAASAGGIPALKEVLRGLPPDLNAPVLILLHLSPRYKSQLATVLTGSANFPVMDAVEGAMPEPAHAYVALPDQHLEIDASGRIHLSKTEKRHFTRPSAEPLFSSVSSLYGPDAVLVVLSGSGSNGSDNLTIAKQRGSWIIAQDPETAFAPGMPRAAIQTGTVDYVLPLDRIAERITELVSR